MYVCVCHGFTERDVRSADRPGATVSDLYRALDVHPGCGKCVPMVRDLVRAGTRGGLTDRSAAP